MQSPKYKIGDKHYSASYRRQSGEVTDIRIHEREVVGILLHPDSFWVYIMSIGKFGEKYYSGTQIDYPVHTGEDFPTSHTKKCDDEYCRFLRVDDWVSENNFCDSYEECMKQAQEREQKLGPRIRAMQEEARKRVEERNVTETN